MAKKAKDRFVVMNRSFTYELDNNLKRTLPVGWAGMLEGKQVEAVDEAGAGRIDEDREKLYLEKQKAAEKVADAEAKAEADAAAKVKADAKAEADTKAKAIADAEAQAKADADAQAKADADAAANAGAGGESTETLV